MYCRKLTFIIAHILFSTLLFAQSVPQSLNMSLLGRWEQDSVHPCTPSNRCYSDLWGYVDCQGNEYALLGSASEINVINITDPANPQLVYHIAGGNVTTWRDMMVYHNRLYACVDGGNEGLIILNLDNLPDSVSFVKQTSEFFTSAHTIFIDELHGRLYATGTNTHPDGLIILDLTQDPNNPTLIGSPSLPGGGYMHESFVRDNIVYGSHGYNGFYIWDCTDPQNPILKASISNVTGYNHTSWLTEDNRYAIFSEEVPAGQPLYVVDLQNIDNGEIEVVHTFKQPLLLPEHLNSIYHQTIIRDDYFITSAYEDGTHIFDISDILNPQLVAYYDLNPNNTVYNGYFSNWGTFPFFPSGNIISSDMQTGLFVLKADSIIWDPIYPPNPPVPTIILNDSTLKVLEVNYTYQWFWEGLPIDGATAQTYTPTQSGNYAVQITNLNGCATTSAPFYINTTATNNLTAIKNVIVSPNPASDKIFVNFYVDGLTDITIQIINAVGQRVKTHRTTAIGTSSIGVSLQDLPEGIYYLQLQIGKQQKTEKFIVKH